MWLYDDHELYQIIIYADQNLYTSSSVATTGTDARAVDMAARHTEIQTEKGKNANGIEI